MQPENVTTINHAENLCKCYGDDPNEVAGKDSVGPATEKPILVLIIVCSAVKNFEQRYAIRKTWASTYNPINLNSTIRIGFLLGLPDNNTLQVRFA